MVLKLLWYTYFIIGMNGHVRENNILHRWPFLPWASTLTTYFWHTCFIHRKNTTIFLAFLYICNALKHASLLRHGHGHVNSLKHVIWVTIAVIWVTTANTSGGLLPHIVCPDCLWPSIAYLACWNMPEREETNHTGIKKNTQVMLLIYWCEDVD